MSEAADNEILRAVIDAFPMASFLVQNDVCVVAYNTSASKALNLEAECLGKLTGNILSCANALEYGCGRSRVCNGCDVRLAILSAFDGRPVERKATTMRVTDRGESREAHLLISTRGFAVSSAPRVLLIVEDITELATLSGLLPLCAHCLQERDEPGYRAAVESYVQDHDYPPFLLWTCDHCRSED